MKNIFEKAPQLKKHLFEKGFLITDDEKIQGEEYPFYGNWSKTTIGCYYFWVHNGAKLFMHSFGDKVVFLVGHAYNPFKMELDEETILKTVAASYETNKYFDAINELTGIFILGIVNGEKIEFLLDASGMQYGCYGEIRGKQYISSHACLIGDILGLEQSEYVKKLVNYKWYSYMMGYYMPGDITSYSELKRIIPNTYVRFNKEYTVQRFYPTKCIEMCKTDAEYEEVLTEATEVLKNTMKLISKKWQKPAISLTGGIDSQTTFAAANGIYDKYETFSYVAMYRESVDAEKAKEISDRFGLSHKIYQITEHNEDIENFDIYKRIFEHNGGDIGTPKDNDTRKKITLIQNDVCDVEVKSWISETIRAYAYKYFGKKKFPKNLSLRNYTSLYKIFFMNRHLVWKTDKFFAEYLNNTKLKENLFNYDESDFFVWEMMHGGKCGLDIGVMKSCFDITIPYNNRKLLDLLLRVPLKYRLNDKHHLDMKRMMNKELYDMNIRVVNLNETKARKRFANLYFTINSFLPF